MMNTIEHVHNMVFRTITAVSPLAITMTGVPSGGTPSVQNNYRKYIVKFIPKTLTRPNR